MNSKQLLLSTLLLGAALSCTNALSMIKKPMPEEQVKKTVDEKLKTLVTPKEQKEFYDSVRSLFVSYKNSQNTQKESEEAERALKPISARYAIDKKPWTTRCRVGFGATVVGLLGALVASRFSSNYAWGLGAVGGLSFFAAILSIFKIKNLTSDYLKNPAHADFTQAKKTYKESNDSCRDKNTALKNCWKQLRESRKTVALVLNQKLTNCFKLLNGCCQQPYLVVTAPKYICESLANNSKDFINNDIEDLNNNFPAQQNKETAKNYVTELMQNKLLSDNNCYGLHKNLPGFKDKDTYLAMVEKIVSSETPEKAFNIAVETDALTPTTNKKIKKKKKGRRTQQEN